jgi:hypothetical protein
MSRLSQITEEQKARMRQVAVKLQTASLPIVKYQNCRFEMGSSAGITDITGLDFIAAYDQLVACWKLFLNRQLKDARPPVLVAEGGIPIRPESYPKEQWPEDEKGRTSDPWALQYELPLISCDDGRHILFQASTIITRALIGRLLEACVDVGKRPFVVPEVNANPDKPEQMLPDFRITQWSDDDSDIPVISPSSPLNGSSALATGATGAATSIKAPASMDDDIPFGAEFR